MSGAQHVPGSLAALAEAARMMPWDKTITDVPFNARYAFQQAITADDYLAALDALRPFARFACGPAGQCECHNCKARDVIVKATGRGA